MKADESTAPTTWLAIVGSVERVRSIEAQPWWCVPIKARRGDNLLLYCPRSVSQSSQGIFASGIIDSDPSDKLPENVHCRGFGLSPQKGSLRYVTFSSIQRFNSPLTAKEMKLNPKLAFAPFIRRNFQGTAFLVESAFAAEILFQIHSSCRNTK